MVARKINKNNRKIVKEVPVADYYVSMGNILKPSGIEGDDQYKETARLRNINFMKPVSAFKGVCRSYGLPPSTATLISNQVLQDTNTDLETDNENDYNYPINRAVALELIPSREENEEIFNKWNLAWKDAKKLVGICSGYGQAASGVLMERNYIPNFPVDCSNVFAFDSHEAEELGYIKYDLLSVAELGNIKDAINAIHNDPNAYKNIDWEDTNDPEVYKQIEDDPDFVFQLASNVPHSLAKKLHPRNVDDLAVINALNRPGPLGSGMVDDYVDVSTGKRKPTTTEQILAKILTRGIGTPTSGILIFQESVMFLFTYGIGATLVESDDIRRAMGKKKLDVLLPWHKRFISDWKYPQAYVINGIAYEPQEKIYLEDGSSLTAKEIVDRCQAGESFDIKEDQPNATAEGENFKVK